MITDNITIAAECLRKDQLVAIPTETVYGLAGNAFSEIAVRKIFELKQRPFFNPLIVHIKSIDYLDQVAINIPQLAYDLATSFWPGPLTLLLTKKEIVPDIVTAGKSTVAIRIPSQARTLELLNILEFPLAAPSANPFGSVSPTTTEHVADYFGEKLPVILDGGACERGVESTIVGFEDGKPVVYRLGALSVEEFQKNCSEIRFRLKDDHTPQAPGMLSRHYAPRTRIYLTNDVVRLSKEFSGKKTGVLLLSNRASLNADHIEVLSPSADLNEAAKNLYAALHRLDQMKLDVIIAERMPDVGIGRTMNDRLSRAVVSDN
jgi:L-threonylcarbamoyladenylate synthase